MMIRSYSELITIPTFEERFEYLKLGDKVGEDTFGYDRYINQAFYRSREWKTLRAQIIARDLGCDLGMEDRPIPRGVKVFIHHMNPISVDDIRHSTDFLLDPEYLITTIKLTHDAIHYGDASILLSDAPIERAPNDTSPWRTY